MGYLLSLHASTRKEKSFSNQLLAEFEASFHSQHPGLNTRSRFLGDIPHLDFEAQAAGRAVAGLAPGQQADWVVLDPQHLALAGLSAPEMLSAHVFASHRSSAIAEPADPTPGRIARSQPPTSSTSSAPSRRIAISTERMFPAL